MYVHIHTYTHVCTYACTGYVSVCVYECKVATCTTTKQKRNPLSEKQKVKKLLTDVDTCIHVYIYIHTHIHRHTINIHKERTGKERMIKKNLILLEACDHHIPCKADKLQFKDDTTRRLRSAQKNKMYDEE